MRYIHFDNTDEHKSFYGMLLEAIPSSTKTFNARTEGRKLDKVMDKLEAIKEFPALCEFEDAEYKIMMDALDGVTWTASGVRKSYKLLEWLDKAPDKPLSLVKNAKLDAVRDSETTATG